MTTQSNLFTGWMIAMTVGLCACEEIPSKASGGGAEGGNAAAGGSPAGGGGAPFETGRLLDVPVTGAVHVDLDEPAIVTADDDWELRFEGLDVFTNGGVSGSRSAAAFGPLSAPTLLADSVPEVPFLIEDYAGGPFLDWYAYDGSTHAIYSRYHVYGVRRGDELYKVVILSYYGEEQGAPISALYQVLAARLDEPGDAVAYQNIDGTAGGLSPGPDDPSGCIRLSTGNVVLLSPEEAASSPDWDLCFRRDAISVNGGVAGAAGVEAVDLMGAETESERLDEVEARTPESERPAFDAVDSASLADPSLVYLADGPVSAFTGAWLEAGVTPVAPASAAWLVAGADGTTPFLIAFDGFEGATSSGVGTVHLRVKRIGGSLP